MSRYLLSSAALLAFVTTAGSVARAEAAACCGVVFVANGAGDFRCTTKALTQAIAAEGVPLRVETVFWSHGYLHIVADQLDLKNVRYQGARLAGQLTAMRQQSPDLPLYVLGHCAGCAVALAAAEEVPPHTIDRVIMLSPSVNSCYDLRRALRGTRDGMDVFFSEKDCWCLGVGLRCMLMLGMRKCCPPSGRVGFQPVVGMGDDGCDYSKLRQYPWVPGLECVGHNGGHYGCYQQGFLRSFVLPLMTGH